MSKFTPAIPSKPETFTMVLPGVNEEAHKLSEELLLKNNKEFHIFFNEKKFHNHFVHHILAAYSFGADKEKLQEIFEIHAKTQRPLPPSTRKITRENYKEYLDKADAYPDFLVFFQSEVDKYGMLDTVRRWVWHGDFLARTLAGLFHPLIHIGYGLEFELPSIVAEGLSMTACTEASYSQIIPHLPKLQTGSLTSVQIQSYAENAGSSARGLASQLISMLSDKVSGLGINDPMASPSHTSNTTTTKDDAAIDSHLSTIPPYLRENKLFEIFAKIKHDPAFDGIVSPELNNEFHKVLSNPNVTSRIKHYVQLWHLDQNQKDIQSKFKDLHLFSALALGAAAIREDHPGVIKLDFFLMHALTSSEFVHQYLSHITPSEAVILLHGQLASFIVAYIVANRPTLNVEGLLKYKSSLDNIKTNNPWTMAIDKSLDCKEAHVIKSVRSCAVGQVISGRHQDVRLNEIWLKVAKMCIEVDGNWTFGVGFDEKWE
ncbi:hypothetical protein G6F61_000147 [Rhizopus arrhizus]|uniref:Oxidoreductase AflY n=1 Tax=Rhizopus oryzae TaxID=64495 RepID=A0A9P6XJF1_RHIOR|nr:hypothetical protein G6F64_000957 [Rhizopus arrhizus]KAG1384754.1 hypothetical protein G6F61_000147 [Rhizopus arrhizus]